MMLWKGNEMIVGDYFASIQDTVTNLLHQLTLVEFLTNFHLDLVP